MERLEYRPLAILVIGLILGLAMAVGVGWLLSIHLRRPGRRPARSRRVRPARRGVLLMNPGSGEGKVVRFDLVEEARRRGIHPVVLHQGEDLRALAENAVAQGADVIGVAGGDGSQAMVADVARTHDLPFVCVPAGLRNHFALDLGLDRNDVTAALDGFGEAVERRVDLAAVGGRIFVNNAALGLHDPVFLADKAGEERRDAELAVAGPAGPDPAAVPVDVGLRFDGPDGMARDGADLVLVSNNPYCNRQLVGAGTRPRLDTAELGVVVVRSSRPRDESTMDEKAPPDLEQWAAPTFRMDSADLIPIGLDGESLELAPPLEFRVLPGALRVRLPRSAPGAGQDAAGGIFRKFRRRR